MTSPLAPLLSVVVPVHCVAEYLPTCLDSILAEAGAGELEVEVVAVDDASPDGCGAILDEYARRDPRVRAVHLATNVGLGRARNAGRERARGTYVWFVDGDDWLPRGALPAVRDRLLATAPDVLVLDHVEVHPDGTTRPTGNGPVLRGVREPVPVSRRPELLGLGLATSACTKVIRRGLLDETDLRFPPGWYEDCAYTYPLLLAARRVDALDRVCYCYRRRAAGAITGSRSARHFDVFEQYDRMWTWIDRTSPASAEELRPELFRRMVDHLLVIAGNGDRLPPERRRAFFGRLAQAYRERLPAGGYPAPGGMTGLKHRLVRGDAYGAYAALRLAWRAVAPLRRQPAAVKDTSQPVQAVQNHEFRPT